MNINNVHWDFSNTSAWCKYQHAQAIESPGEIPGADTILERMMKYLIAGLALLICVFAQADEDKDPPPMLLEILTKSEYSCAVVKIPSPLAAVCQSYKERGNRYLICTERDGTVHEFIVEGRSL